MEGGIVCVIAQMHANCAFYWWDSVIVSHCTREMAVGMRIVVFVRYAGR